jgi:hypothetical protein
MPKPFITFAPQYRERAAFIEACLCGLGFEPAIYSAAEDSRAARQRASEDILRADCCIALLSTEPDAAPGQATVAPWIARDIGLAEDRDLPFAMLRDRGILSPSRAAEEGAVKSIEVDLSSDTAVLAAVPQLFRIAHAFQNVLQRGSRADGSQWPFYFDEVHIVNEWTRESWRHCRVIALAARRTVAHVDHGVDVGWDKTQGLSVRLADWSDLKVECLTEPGRISDPIRIDNTDAAVNYKLEFNPPLKAGEVIRYRHESVHKMIFPLTLKQLNSRRSREGCPPYLREGFVGESFDVSRPIKRLVLELVVPLDLGLSSPQVKVYQLNTTTELVDESERVGTQQTNPRNWRDFEDHARGLWNVQVTIDSPELRSYYLVVRPTK